MKSIVPNDQDTMKEIQEGHLLMTDLIRMAEAKEQSGEYMDAYEYYFKAQELSFPVGEGAVLKIKPERIDEGNWHKINEKLIQLGKIIFH